MEEVNGTNVEFRDNGVSPGELGEVTSQSDVGGVEQFKKGGGRVGQDPKV